ncbi:MAG: inorganic diphosphatase [Candidatus Micrarchaeia archaeon]
MTGLSDLKQPDNYPDEFDVVVEIPQGSSSKIELDGESGAFKLDRVLHSPMFYPCSYGFVPSTHYLDGDPVDVCLVSTAKLFPGLVVRCRAIGVLPMKDEAGVDNKVLAVPLDGVDPRMVEVRSVDDLPSHFRDELALFFSDYKKLEKGKQEFVKVESWQGVEEALKILQEALKK